MSMSCSSIVARCRGSGTYRYWTDIVFSRVHQSLHAWEYRCIASSVNAIREQGLIVLQKLDGLAFIGAARTDSVFSTAVFHHVSHSPMIHARRRNVAVDMVMRIRRAAWEEVHFRRTSSSGAHSLHPIA